MKVHSAPHVHGPGGRPRASAKSGLDSARSVCPGWQSHSPRRSQLPQESAGDRAEIIGAEPQRRRRDRDLEMVQQRAERQVRVEA